MNSLFKFYSKRTLLLLSIGILFAILFTYIIHANYAAYYSEMTSEYDTGYIYNMLSEFSSSCFIINAVLMLILTYSFNMYRNKKTGVFIRQLPVKADNDFIVKVILSLLLISLLIFFEVAIFNLFIKGTISQIYNDLVNFSHNTDVYIEPLNKIYSGFYINFAQLSLLVILLSSALTLFMSTIGVNAFAIAMPIILFFSYIGYLAGIYTFRRDLEIGNYVSSFLMDIIFLIDTAKNNTVNNLYNITKFYDLLIAITSLVLYIGAFFCNKYINYSKIGQIFIFKWVKVLAYVIGCVFGGFSFYYIGSNIMSPNSNFTSLLILLISFIISYLIIRKTEKIFM